MARAERAWRGPWVSLPATLVLAIIVVRLAWPAPPRAVPAPGATPITCSIRPVGVAERKAVMAGWAVFQQRPERLTDAICRNVLAADGAFARVEFKNESLEDVALIPGDGRLFWVSARVEDASGKPVVFEQPGLRSLKRLSVVDPTRRPVVLRPGQSETQPFAITGPGAALLDIKPGRYRVRAVGRGIRARDRSELVVESAPMWVTITADDLRAWHALLDEPPPGIEEPAP